MLSLQLVTATAPTSRPRKEQERSRRTRSRLLDAVVECLVDLGYAGTTTQEVAKRAGVTRGALLHHYPTREQLVAAAIAHLDLTRLQDFERRFATLDPRRDVAEEFVDLLWSLTRDRNGYAELELLNAARTDSTLHAALAPYLRRRSEAALETPRELLGVPHWDPELRAMRDLLFHALRGLSLAILFDHDEEGARFERNLLVEMVQRTLERAREKTR